ncbi:winged helix-turn-helix domain-containing protein [Pseudoalteromonas luteoviolacea]|nr:winged helix-turn-helix domain-containing protein [Pseudoalteromonas luteoviolacea]
MELITNEMKEVSFSRTVKEVRFGAWVLDPKLQTIYDGEVKRELEPLLFKILCYLIINNQQIITRHDLIEDVWCQNYVDDNAINRAMSELRKVLKSNQQRGLVVKTHYRKGYSFFLSAEVIYFDNQTEVINTLTPSKEEPDNTQSFSTSNRIKLPLIGSVCLAALVSIFLIYKPVLPTEPDTEAVSSFESNYEEHVLSWVDGEYANVFSSPDAKKVAFSFTPNGLSNSNLVIKDLDSGIERKLAVSEKSISPIGWDEDSSRLFYRVDGADEVCEIWSADADLESGGDKLFDCKDRIYRGSGVGEGHFIYSKYNYRQRDQLSVVTYRTLDTGNEFQLTSPNLNSYGDRFLLYEPSIRRVFFERRQHDIKELYMTDLDGSDKTKIFSASSSFWELKYVKSTNSLVWFDNRTNLIYTYSIDGNKLSSIAQLPLDTVTYLGHSFISESKMVATTFPHEQSIYTVSLDDKSLTPLINEKYIDIKAVRAGDDVYFFRVQGEEVVVMYAEKSQGGYRYSELAGGINQDILYDYNNKLLILKADRSIKVFNEANELIDEIIEQGVISDVNVLKNGDIGYIVVGEGGVGSHSYVYSVRSRKKSLLPIKNNVWFDTGDGNRLFYLTSDDRLKLIDIETREEYLDIDFPSRVSKHLIVKSEAHIYYANGNIIYRLVDGEWTVFMQLEGGIKVINMSYSPQHKQLVLGTLKRKNNQLVLLDINAEP